MSGAMLFIRNFRRYLFLSLVLLSSFSYVSANKKVLVLVEGKYDLKSFATAEGRELVNLLGHFDTKVAIRGTFGYTRHEIEDYEAIFYIGYSKNADIPAALAQDFLSTQKTVVWINRGIESFCNQAAGSAKLGFTAGSYEENSVFDHVRADNRILTKGSSSITPLTIINTRIARVLALAYSEKTKKETPYIICSGKFWYIADSPFKNATETDRYLLFADLLHDILNEPHEKNHLAIIRIEDVNPNSNPDNIRDIAEVLSKRNVPFLIGVSPFYVNPSENIRFGLTERPEMVDALKFAVEHGASIVMHGETHQYHGISAEDFEFWDGSLNAVIRGETAEAIAEKLENGIEEFMKVGLYPLTWETPHYTASVLSYTVFAKFFSSAVEQPMVIDNRDFGQYLPYIVNKDIYGRTVFPENLGYVVLNKSLDSERVDIKRIMSHAQVIHQNVRDGIASFYYHSFMGNKLLEELIDGIRKEGFDFLDIRQYKHKVQTSDRVILCGSQSYQINLNDAFLYESYFDHQGDLMKRITSPNRITGVISKDIELSSGYIYKAEPTEYLVRELSMTEKISNEVVSFGRSLFPKNTSWQEARAAVLCLPSARGAAYNDQTSFIAALKSINMFVDVLNINRPNDLSKYNLIVVPFAAADSLSKEEVESLRKFVEMGGNLISDRRNKLVSELGFKFSKSQADIRHLRDRMFVTENIMWKFAEVANKVDCSSDDEIFCDELNTKNAVAIGRKMGDGRIIYFNTAFDPYSELGYSRFPFLMDYIKNYFHLLPILKRENLEFYFDPGFRQNISIETLIKQWVKDGIRIVHVAGWHEWMKYTYDYERLIRLAHANGILVYAWLEPPGIGQKFWTSHPEWREKNYKGEDVRASWRYIVALTDEKCLNEVIKSFSKLLTSYDWDGVNLAELYFDSDNGLGNPEKFTPMHKSAQKEVQKKYGFNIRDIFEPYSGYYWDGNEDYTSALFNYRIDKITYLHKRFLDEFYKIAESKKGFQVMVTVMDSYGSPELKPNHGINTEKIIELQKKYGFLLQIEDPQNRWSETPVRYKSIGDQYAALVDRNKLLVDLNILAFRSMDEITPFPTLIQTGTEAFHLINSSALGAPRFTIYGEASVNPQDVPYFSYASASVVKCSITQDGYHVSSPYSFVMSLPGKIHVIKIDGKPVIGMRDNMYVIPAGEHSIETKDQDISGFSTVALQPQIVSFTGNIIDLSYDMQKVKLTYESEGRSLLALNREFSSVAVDGQSYTFEMMRGNDCCVIFLPGGKHDVVIATGNKISFGINITSLWSTTAIVIFGSLAVILLLFMYLLLKFIRRRAA